jgi:phosphohistidine phosphatase SixA
MPAEAPARSPAEVVRNGQIVRMEQIVGSGVVRAANTAEASSAGVPVPCRGA